LLEQQCDWTLVTQEAFAPKIYVIRNEPVVLDGDLALLYGVTTGNFNKAINRNERRFSFGLFVCAYSQGICRFDIPNWNIKTSRRATQGAARFYGARRDHGRDDFE
jgi:hypothetical protein